MDFCTTKQNSAIPSFFAYIHKKQQYLKQLAMLTEKHSVTLQNKNVYISTYDSYNHFDFLFS